MYEFLTGEFVSKAPTHVVIDIEGVGYYVHISLNTYSSIKDLNHGRLFVSFQVKEDAHTLYGFAEESERNLFIHLISVSGIGPNTGRMILSSLTPDEIQAAIITGNVSVLKAIKGIGPKTAQRMILELQDKLSKHGGVSGLHVGVSNGAVSEEAASALVMLGFQRSQVDKCLGQLVQEQPATNVENLIKEALKRL